ncbi:MAG: lysylphosphatidylglycerol synthase domain-containing protein [Crocinitomicaceae bacterium]|nr:lysylphosphatidylglycerol synthase domain-containing protein [Crocinitomicaceae bacterium]
MKSVFQSLKVQKTLLWSVKILVFVFVLYYFAARLRSISTQDIEGLTLSDLNYALFTLLLVPVNWGIEFVKWLLIAKSVGTSYSMRKYGASLFTGISTGIITPNRIGNFIGRVIYFDYKERALLTLGTLYGNLAQFLATVFFGLVGLYFTSNTAVGLQIGDWLLGFGFFAVVGAIILYFVFPFVPLRRFNVFKRRLNTLLIFQKSSKRTFLLLFFLSGARYLVFILQFTLLLIAFGADFSYELIYSLYVLYFASTLTPNLIMGKLVVRETIGLVVLAEVVSNPMIILTASLSLWVINLGIPSLIGLFFVVQSKRSVL